MSAQNLFPKETKAAGENRFTPELNEKEDIELLEDLSNILGAFLIKLLFTRTCWIRDGYSQLSATRLVGYLSSHIQRALVLITHQQQQNVVAEINRVCRHVFLFFIGFKLTEIKKFQSRN